MRAQWLRRAQEVEPGIRTIKFPHPSPTTIGCGACSISLLSVNFNFFIYERGAGMISTSYKSQLTTNASSLAKLNKIACTGMGRVLGSVSVCCATLALNAFLPASKFSLHTYFNLTAIKLPVIFPASPQGCFHSCGCASCLPNLVRGIMKTEILSSPLFYDFSQALTKDLLT